MANLTVALWERKQACVAFLIGLVAVSSMLLVPVPARSLDLTVSQSKLLQKSSVSRAYKECAALVTAGLSGQSAFSKIGCQQVMALPTSTIQRLMCSDCIKDGLLWITGDPDRCINPPDAGNSDLSHKDVHGIPGPTVADSNLNTYSVAGTGLATAWGSYVVHSATSPTVADPAFGCSLIYTDMTKPDLSKLAELRIVKQAQKNIVAEEEARKDKEAAYTHAKKCAAINSVDPQLGTLCPRPAVVRGDVGGINLCLGRTVSEDTSPCLATSDELPKYFSLVGLGASTEQDVIDDCHSRPGVLRFTVGSKDGKQTRIATCTTLDETGPKPLPVLIVYSPPPVDVWVDRCNAHFTYPRDPGAWLLPRCAPVIAEIALGRFFMRQQKWILQGVGISPDDAAQIKAKVAAYEAEAIASVTYPVSQTFECPAGRTPQVTYTDDVLPQGITTRRLACSPM